MQDTFITKIGERGARPYDRLWIEDSFGRLGRNGFTPGTAFDAVNRAGVGLVIRPALVGRCHVSQRRAATVLSYEARGLADAVRSHEVRVKVCVSSIVVMPCLRLFSIARPMAGVWRITKDAIVSETGSQPLVTQRPLRFSVTPSRIEAELTVGNVIFATEVIGNIKPGEVMLTGEPLMVTVGGQFLTAAGYVRDEGGVWRR